MKLKVRKYQAVLLNDSMETEVREGCYCGKQLKTDVRSHFQEMGYKVLYIQPLEYGTYIINNYPRFLEVSDCEFSMKEESINE